MNVLAVGNNQFILKNLYSYTKGYKNINFFNVKSTSQLIIQFKEVDKIILCFRQDRDSQKKKLSQVINHYTNDIQASATLSSALKKPIALSANDKVDLIAFLLTLSDKEFVFNPKHQYPKEILIPTKEK